MALAAPMDFSRWILQSCERISFIIKFYTIFNRSYCVRLWFHVYDDDDNHIDGDCNGVIENYDDPKTEDKM